MGNIVSFQKATSISYAEPAALAYQFSTLRLPQSSAMWLKENAEFLNVLQSTHVPNAEDAVAYYDAFYQDLDQTFAFFPQYYRFLISIALDLEDLGMKGQKAEQMIAKANADSLQAAELSDLQRGEAARLYARRGVVLSGSALVQERLLNFAGHSAQFAIPNRKIGYELTHIIFYLTNYGQQTFEFNCDIQKSLTYTGAIAHLQENYDLLAEVIAAQVMAGFSVPEVWQQDVMTFRSGFLGGCDAAFTGQDAYHGYLMANWAGLLQDENRFSGAPTEGGAFVASSQSFDALEQVSALLFAMGVKRGTHWEQLKPQIMNNLSQGAAAHLEKVSSSVAGFDRFFECFARAVPPEPSRRTLRAFH